MSRPIKLRVWDKINRVLSPLTCLSQLTDPNLEVTQFTGVYDMVGREIYEGDITRWSFDDQGCRQAGVYHYLVGFESGSFGTNTIDDDDFTPYTEASPSKTELVVGNRFMDSDLLLLNVEW